MLTFQLALKEKRPLRILCVGAHSDDIEIGCGGTILRLLQECAEAEVQWVVLGSSGQRVAEALLSAHNFLAHARKKNVIVKNFKNSFFPYVGAEIKTFFEELKETVSPDVIFTHYRNDLHQDHRLISELTWNTYRNHLILEYEVLKYDGDLGVPNFFVHLNASVCQQKVRLILDCFQTQTEKDWFTSDAFWSLLRLRGIESKAPEKYAEGFYCRKVVL
jgi:LmbE family N-acetylglucosaminyl deacetylase